MGTLILREFRDSKILIAAIAFVIIALNLGVGYGIYNHYYYNAVMNLPHEFFNIFYASFAVGLYFLLAAFGVNQMQSDKNSKISTFLCTLATTRKQIFVARVLSGLSVIAAVVAVTAITQKLLFNWIDFPVPIDLTLLYKHYVVSTALLLACYTAGLLAGGRSNVVKSLVFAIIIAVLLTSVVFLKGINYQSAAVLAVFSLAGIIKAFYKYLHCSMY